MNILSRAIVLAFVPLAACFALGCAAESEEEGEGDVSEDELRKGKAEQWIYGGTLPHLESPSLTVSLTAHTVRVTGFLPPAHDKPLPYYVDSVKEGGRTRIAVVYPIATGSSVNSQRTNYVIDRLSPWVPTNSKATWGGFPFIPYNGGIAFHGPITAAEGQWKLVRGPVSHGCNRMQGEHVVELANLIGADMTSVVYDGTGVDGLHVPVTVLRKPDEWKGQPVDVDYPAQRGVARPTGPNVKMFKSWSADDLGTFVCPLNKRELNGAKTVPADYCGRTNRNAFDPAVGPAR